MVIEKYNIDRKYFISAYTFDLYKNEEWLGEFITVDDTLYKKDSSGNLILSKIEDLPDIINLVNLT